MFSDAISSISWRWRPSSPEIALAISGSASESPAVKNEPGAEALLALREEELMGGISPPPRPGLRCHGRSFMAVERAFARYHITPARPSACGRRLIFMQDMEGGPPLCQFLDPRRRQGRGNAIPRRLARVVHRTLEQ